MIPSRILTAIAVLTSIAAVTAARAMAGLEVWIRPLNNALSRTILT